MRISIIFTIFFILQTLVSGVMPQEMVAVLVPSPFSPIKTSSGVHGSVQCTKNSDESYAVCASKSNVAVKYNLQPFSFAAKGPDQGQYMTSCDLYEADSQSSSGAVCVKAYSGSRSPGVVYFHRVSDMINVTNVTIGTTWSNPSVVVDSPNQIAYVSNFNTPPAIHKITIIGSPTPIFAATLSSFDAGDSRPAAMLIIDGFLYVHFFMNPARLARINISTFTWNHTVEFRSEEIFGLCDNLANDNNFIYDLTQSGILVRCTYKNNKFARFDSLNTGLSNTHSLAISPDLRSLFVSRNGDGVLQMIDVSSFSLFGNAVSVPNAFGRPIVTSSRNVYAFTEKNDLVFLFQYSNRATSPIFTAITDMFDFTELIVSVLITILLLLYASVRHNNINQVQQELEKERKRADLAEKNLQQKDLLLQQKHDQLHVEKSNAANLVTEVKQKDQQLQQQSSEITQLNQQLLTLQSQLNNINSPAPSSPFVKDKFYQIDYAANGITPPADPNAFGTLIKIPSQNNSVLFQHVKNELWKKLGTSWPSPAPVNLFTLESIEVIYSNVTTLEGRMRRLQQLRSQNGTFFNPPTGTFTAEQLQTLIALRDQFLPRSSNADPKSPNLINVFHGTKADHLQSVVNGLVAVRSTDAGYFGSGVYTTTSIEYAAKYARGDFDTNNGPYPPRASDGCFPVVWFVAAVGVCYPLTREVDYSKKRVHDGTDVSDFFGAPLTPGYDCHCVAVNESVGFQAVPRKEMQYMEVVFDQEVQVLPIAVLWVKPI